MLFIYLTKFLFELMGICNNSTDRSKLADCLLKIVLGLLVLDFSVTDEIVVDGLSVNN